MTKCFNELKERRDEVIEEQDSILEKMEETIENILPKMTNATNSKQLIEVNKEAQTKFDSIKLKMKNTVADYSKWSHDIGDKIRKSNRDCLKGLKGTMIDASIIKVDKFYPVKFRYLGCKTHYCLKFSLNFDPCYRTLYEKSRPPSRRQSSCAIKNLSIPYQSDFVPSTWLD